MNPADQALVQKHLGATLAKVAAIRQGLAGAKKTLEKQEQALYAATQQQQAAADRPAAPLALPPVQKSASILDGEVDMSSINAAIRRLEKGCECPNLPSKKEGT